MTISRGIRKRILCSDTSKLMIKKIRLQTTNQRNFFKFYFKMWLTDLIIGSKLVREIYFFYRETEHNFTMYLDSKKNIQYIHIHVTHVHFSLKLFILSTLF